MNVFLIREKHHIFMIINDMLHQLIKAAPITPLPGQVLAEGPQSSDHNFFG